MRIFANVHCEGHTRRFEIAVGAGDKTFKWLSLAASQLYASSAPNGALRRRDDYRGATKDASLHAVNMLIGDNLTPHPASLISDYLRDLDTIDITLISEMPVNKNGIPTSTNWATLAFTSTEDHNSILYDEENFDDKKLYKKPEILANERAKSEFMRIIMRPQMLNEKRRAHEIKTIWPKVLPYIPNLKENDIIDIQDVLFKEWAIINEAFLLYSPDNKMDLKEFQRLCEDSKIFSEKDLNLLTTRAFNRILKLCNNKLNKLDIESGSFIAILIIISQSRHNDIFEKDSIVSSPKGYLQEILSNNFRILAQRLSFKCLPKEILCSAEFLQRLRDVYDDLVAVFEKYAARHNRDIYTSLPFEHVSELLFESKIADSLNVDNVKSLFKRVQSGPINGRDEVQPPHPINEYLFPELVEAAVLLQYDNAVKIMNGQKPLTSHNNTSTSNNNQLLTNTSLKNKINRNIPTPLPETVHEEISNEPISRYPILPSELQIPIDILEIFTTAIQKLVNALHYVPEETIKKRNY